MRSVVRHALVGVLAGYVVAWLVAFAGLVGTPSLLGRYAVWSWTGGGERVAFVQLAGLLGAALGAVVGSVAAVLRRRRFAAP